MRVKIISERCIACGLCHLEAPHIFDYDDAGIVRFYGSSVKQKLEQTELLSSVKQKLEQTELAETNELEQEIPPAEEKQAGSAVKKCPTAALKASNH